MHLWKRLFDFILFSNIYLAVVIALACFATCATFNVQWTFAFMAFIIFSTCSSYCLHWALPQSAVAPSHRDLWSLRNTKLLVVFAVLCFVAGCVYFLYLPAHALVYILPLVFFTFLYTAPKINIPPFVFLRKLVIAKTFYLSLVLTYATVFLPILLFNKLCSADVYAYAMIRFLSIYCVCILFDFRDREMDTVTGIKTFLNKLNNKIFYTLIQGLLFFTILAAIYVVLNTPNILKLNVTVQLILPNIILIFLCKKSIHTKNVYWYYGLLDGILCLPVLGLLF